MNCKFKIILLSFFLITNINVAFSQKSTIIKHVAKENLEESSESIVRSKMKNLGLSFTEKAIVN